MLVEHVQGYDALTQEVCSLSVLRQTQSSEGVDAIILPHFIASVINVTKEMLSYWTDETETEALLSIQMDIHQNWFTSLN